MKRNTRNGLVGLIATVIPNAILRLAFPDIFTIFTGNWWYLWFPLYFLWLGFLVVGLASRGGKDDNRGEIRRA